MTLSRVDENIYAHHYRASTSATFSCVSGRMVLCVVAVVMDTPQRAMRWFHPCQDMQHDLVLTFQVGDDGPDLIFCYVVDPEVFFGHDAVFRRLPVLAHHYYGSRVGRLERERKIQEDKRIRIPMVYPTDDVERNPDSQQCRLYADKASGTHCNGDAIRNPVSER